MAHTPAEAPGQDANVTAPVTLRVVVTDGGITDHPFTPWKVVPTRCNTCGKVARRHAVSSTIEGPVVAESKPAPAQAANQAPAPTTAAPAADRKKPNRQGKPRPERQREQAAGRLAKTSASKAAGGQRAAAKR